MEYINGIFSMSLGKCSSEVDVEYESKLESILNGRVDTHKIKHARNFVPSIDQQAKMRILLSTLRPNQ